MSSPPPALTPAFSLYLDLVRVLSAAAVVAAHFAYTGAVAPGAWGVASEMGREAVIVFFVLSGFVIAASTSQRRPDGRAYALSRLARLYSVALPAWRALCSRLPGLRPSRQATVPGRETLGA